MLNLPVALMVAAASALGVAQDAVENTPVSTPVAAEAVAPIDSVDALLDALEEADRDIRTLQGNLVYDRVMSLQGDLHRRFGRLYFQATPTSPGAPPARRFAVHFDKLWIGGRQEDERIDLIFDGRWLVEKDYDQKPRPLLTRREVAPPGADFDPMRLGEGPVPLPLGQRKADILAHFEASMPAAEAGLEETPVYIKHINAGAGSHQLLLVPREGDQAGEKFEEIRLWYEKGTMHPRLACTLSRDGDIAFVQLGAIRLNADLPGDALDPGPPEGDWEVQTIEGRFGPEARPLDNTTTVLPPEDDPGSAEATTPAGERHEETP